MLSPYRMLRGRSFWGGRCRLVGKPYHLSMRTKLAIIFAISLLVAGCSGFQAGSAANADPDLSITSYKSGYGVRTHAPQSAGDAMMDWGL
ncbi:hypothetical protein [Azospirillum soli]|uniref:hypothetical protein n=1 Tax=Azospirillum soli TaxID=1304799 RepID=UPI001AE8309F|nr:hypothetical protein [Azospirillum soli]MBP2311901.1 hypothetical protein [Azospirillum soli]